MHFLALFFFLLSIIIHETDHFRRAFLKLILRAAPVLFLTAVFSCFSCLFDTLTFTLLYSTIYTNYRTFVVPLENSSIVSFDCSRM